MACVRAHAILHPQCLCPLRVNAGRHPPYLSLSLRVLPRVSRLASACHPSRPRLCTQVEAGLGEALQRGYDAVGAPCVTGLLTLRVHVSGADGSVTAIDRLADTLVVDPALLPPARGDDDDDEEEGGDGGSSAVQRERARVLDAIFGELAQVTFATSGGSDEPTQITIPFVFD